MLGALLTLFVVGLAAAILLAIAMAVIGVVFSFAFGALGFLLFKVAPVLLIGWLILKLFERGGSETDPHRLPPADERWLDS